MVQVRAYIGTEFDRDNAALDPRTVETHIEWFKGEWAAVTGGVTTYSATGSSVECPQGEFTLVVETFIEDHDLEGIDRLRFTTRRMKALLNQGSIILTSRALVVEFV